MSQIKPSLAVAIIVAGLALGGCGDKNAQVDFNPDSGKHHDANWVKTHSAKAATAMNSCTECHGSDYKGGISQVSCTSPTAISGFKCHAGSPANSPAGCVSCHGVLPGGPFSNTAPNRNFAHAKHTALLTNIGVTGKDVCDKCHLNAGSGTADHASATAAGDYKSARVTMSPSFKVSTTPGQFGYSDAKCSLVSCHGGIITPAWTDTISMVNGGNAACYQCHQQGNSLGLPQYNSFYSGSFSGTDPVTNLHTSHLGRNALCIDCHNLNALYNSQEHFAGIVTNSFTAPGNTIGNNGSNSPTKTGNYDRASQTCSSVICHPPVWGSIQWSN